MINIIITILASIAKNDPIEINITVAIFALFMAANTTYFLKQITILTNSLVTFISILVLLQNAGGILNLY